MFLRRWVLLTVFFHFSTGQEQQTHAIQLHYCKLTVYKLFGNKQYKSTLIAHRSKSERFVTFQFNVLHSTMLPIATEYFFTAGFRTKYGLVVSQLLSPSTGQTYPSTHQFSSHNMCFSWNKTKSILGAEERARLHRLKLQVLELKQKYGRKTVFKKLCIITCIFLCGRVAIPSLRNRNVLINCTDTSHTFPCFAMNNILL